MPEQVFVVSDGEYSSYCILGIYSTRELAEHAKDLFCANNEIETWELDALPAYPEGMRQFAVLMDESGDTRRVRRLGVHLDYGEWTTAASVSPLVEFYVWAQDEAHAVKIANERRTRLLATGEWTTDIGEWWRRQGPK